MPFLTGGTVHTKRITVTTTPTLLTYTPTGSSPSRSGVSFQQAGAVDVYLGGADVTGPAGAKPGFLLPGTPITTPPTPPADYSEAVTNQAWYAITASGTATIQVTEIY